MFASVVAPTWQALEAAFGNRPGWGFRGQSDALWPLETGLYRESRRRFTDRDAVLHQRESWLLRQFSRYAHQFKHDLPPPENVLDWLALIQHYGGPTRLLDFTHSLQIAAFFALEAAAGDSAIWAVNLGPIRHAAEVSLQFSAPGRIDEQRRVHNQKFEEVFKAGTSERVVLAVEPERMHERLWTQQGFFIAPVDPNVPFLTSLAGTFGRPPQAIDRSVVSDWMPELLKRTSRRSPLGEEIHLLKIILPLHFREDALTALNKMNISAATLFPGLEGFARSLRLHI